MKDDEWYKQNGGNKCPFCESENIEGDGQVQTDSTYAWQKIICLDCKKEWEDQYTLTGFDVPLMQT